MKSRKGEFSVPKRNKELLREVKRNFSISAKQETHKEVSQIRRQEVLLPSEEGLVDQANNT